jgi:elongation factor P
MMLSSGELRKGLVIELDGELYYILDYHHIKLGRGAAQVRLKLRNIGAGHTTERTFSAGEMFHRVILEQRPAQYLYQDGELYYFMNQENFEQIMLDAEQLGEALNYLKEGLTVQISMHEGHPLSVELPISVELKVIDTGPSFKGDTAQGGGKPATLETGITIQVPFFIKSGDIVRVDTRSGEYIERAS